MSFEYERNEPNHSPGSRIFNVCLDHSNQFGRVFHDDRSLYSWNCQSNREVPRPQHFISFQLNVEHRVFPFLYE